MQDVQCSRKAIKLNHSIALCKIDLSAEMLPWTTNVVRFDISREFNYVRVWFGSSIQLYLFENSHRRWKDIFNWLSSSVETAMIMTPAVSMEIISSCYLLWKSTHCGLVTPYDDIDLVNVGSDNGLLLDGTKPLPELMLTHHQWVLWKTHGSNLSGSSHGINL